MAFSFVAAGAGADNGFGTTVTPGVPSGIAAGDTVLGIVVAAGAGTWTPPSGWVAIGSLATGSAYWVGYKIATASEGSTYTFTFSTSQTINGRVVAYRGASVTAPIEASGHGRSVNGQVCTLPDITALGDGRLDVGMCENRYGGPGTWAASGFTVDYSQANVASCVLACSVAVNAGATGTDNVGLSGSATATPFMRVILAPPSSPKGLPVIAHWHAQQFGAGA